MRINTLVLLLALLLPVVAFAQEEPASSAGTSLVETIWNVVQLIAPVVMGSSVVSMFFKSEGGPVRTWIMRIVDFLALNWLKARNDPAVQ